MTPESIEQKGYTDAFFGKDKSDNYSGVEYTAYVIGQERFFTSFLYTKDEEKSFSLKGDGDWLVGSYFQEENNENL